MFLLPDGYTVDESFPWARSTEHPLHPEGLMPALWAIRRQGLGSLQPNIVLWWLLWVQFPELYSRFSLVIYRIHSVSSAWDFPSGWVVKNPPASAGDARDAGFISGLGRSPGEGNGNPLQYSCLENSMDRGTWWATVHGIAEMNMTYHACTMYAYKCVLWIDTPILIIHFQGQMSKFYNLHRPIFR